ncbi:MAG: S8 family serine peptidase [Fretibacterium sp.]|nr:S8 family serine peptidase [Fretibacterium sp.]
MKRRFWLSSLLGILLFCQPVLAGETRPGDVLVMFRGEEGMKVTAASATEGREAFRAASIAASMGARVTARYGALSEAGGGAFVLIHSDTKTEAELIEELKARSDVAAVSPNYVVRLAETKTPNDPRYSELWGLRSIYAPEAWATETGKDSVYVAIIDSGISYGHEDLAGNFDAEHSYCVVQGLASNRYEDQNGHGSHVAGIIGAVGNNTTGVTGVNWLTKLISVRAFGASGETSLEELTAAINYLVGQLSGGALSNLAAVNMSLSVYIDETPSQMSGSSEQVSSAFWQAMSALNKQGVLIVVAAGNEGYEVGAPVPSGSRRGSYVYPASFQGLDNMVVVGAIKEDGSFASSYNWSSKYVHLAAPGVGILSTRLNNSYGSGNGTSFAAPYVSGAAALLKSAIPGATPQQIKSALLEGATTTSALLSYVAGGRQLNVSGALKALNSGQVAPVDAKTAEVDEAASTRTSEGYSTVVVKIASDEGSPQAGDRFYVWLKKSSETAYVRYWTTVVTGGQLNISVGELRNMSDVSVAASISTGTYDILYQRDDGKFSGRITGVALAGTSSSQSGGGGGGCNVAAGLWTVPLALLWMRGKR